MTEIIIPDPSEESVSIELRIHRENTREFIAADPVVLVLTPQVLARQAGGGRKFTAGEEREPQVFRLIPQSDVVPTVQTPDGLQLTPSYVLLGDWDADIDRWDTFEFGGHEYQVVSPVRPLHTERAYEKKADVALR